jgi:hypothetical protein
VTGIPVDPDIVLSMSFMRGERRQGERGEKEVGRRGRERERERGLQCLLAKDRT